MKFHRKKITAVITVSIIVSLSSTVRRQRGLKQGDTICNSVQSISNKSSAVAEMGDRGHNRHGSKRWGLQCPFHAELGPSLIQWSGPRSISVPSGVRLHPSSRLATTDIGQKLGAVPLAPLWEGKLGPHLTQKSPGLRPTSIHTKWHRDPSSRLGTINMGRIFFGGEGELRPLFGEGGCFPI